MCIRDRSFASVKAVPQRRFYTAIEQLSGRDGEKAGGFRKYGKHYVKCAKDDTEMCIRDRVLSDIHSGGFLMTLKDCTKAELLWIIDRLRNRGLYRLDTIIAIALNDLEYQR